ncbi:MAG: DEAD/DEAH box helicase, partial [Candidatus Micrarchaeota archaeon]
MGEGSEPFLKELSLKKEADGLEMREYQINIAKSILRKGNSLVIMPTALGKTFVVVFVMAKFVKEMLDGKRGRKKFLFLTPTRPLASQQ